MTLESRYSSIEGDFELRLDGRLFYMVVEEWIMCEGCTTVVYVTRSQYGELRNELEVGFMRSAYAGRFVFSVLNVNMAILYSVRSPNYELWSHDQRRDRNAIIIIIIIINSIRTIGGGTERRLFHLVLCDTWNWSDDNDTVSGIAILDTTAIPEMRSAISLSFRIRQSQYSVYSQTVAVIKIVCMRVCTVTMYGLRWHYHVRHCRGTVQNYKEKKAN